jgi:hypothetical protein
MEIVSFKFVLNPVSRAFWCSLGLMTDCLLRSEFLSKTPTLGEIQYDLVEQNYNNCENIF